MRKPVRRNPDRDPNRGQARKPTRGTTPRQPEAVGRSSSEWTAAGLLKRFGLSKTGLRLSLLEIFMEDSKALSQAELIERLEKKRESFDRVSVYRNLNSLRSVGLIHELENNAYVSCTHDCQAHGHLLFYCEKCHKHSEVKSHDRVKDIFKALGGVKFFGPSQPISLKGVCRDCGESDVFD